MKPLYILLFAATTLSACKSENDPNAIQIFTGVCKQKSDMYIAITQNGKTRTSVHDNIGSARVAFLGGADSMMRVYLNIDSAANEQPVMLNLVIPAANEPGIYYIDSNAIGTSTSAHMVISQKSYFSKDLKLVISTLGNHNNGAFVIREYAEAAGSFSGSFAPQDGGQPIQASGEFCIDFDGEKN